MEQVKSFKYLRAVISATGDGCREIMAKLGITRSFITGFSLERQIAGITAEKTTNAVPGVASCGVVVKVGH